MTTKGGGVVQPITGTGGGSGGVTQVAALRGGAGARGPRARMIGVFGWRESELAAIAILDAYWMDPYAFVDVKIFQGDTDALRGFVALKQNGWIDAQGMPTRAFWERVHGR